MKTPHSWKWELVSFQQNATRSNGKLASYSFCWEYIIRRSHLQLLEMSLPSDPTADRNRRLGWKRRGDENAQSVSDTDWTFIEGQGRLSPLAVMMAWRPIGADVWIWSASIFPLARWPQCKSGTKKFPIRNNAAVNHALTWKSQIANAKVGWLCLWIKSLIRSDVQIGLSYLILDKYFSLNNKGK